MTTFIVGGNYRTDRDIEPIKSRPHRNKSCNGDQQQED